MEDIHAITFYDPWFLRQIEAIIAAEADIEKNGLPIDAVGLRRLKAMGFSDARLANLAVDSVHVAHGSGRAVAQSSGADRIGDPGDGRCDQRGRGLRAAPQASACAPSTSAIDSCAAEFDAAHALYVFDLRSAAVRRARRTRPSHPTAKKWSFSAAGANRIGQGI